MDTDRVLAIGFGLLSGIGLAFSYVEAKRAARQRDRAAGYQNEIVGYQAKVEDFQSAVAAHQAKVEDYQAEIASLNARRKRLEWTDLLTAANDLAGRVNADDFVPELIVTPSLRGATFANLLEPEFGAVVPVLVGFSFFKSAKKGRGLQSDSGMIHVETSKVDVYIPSDLSDYRASRILILDDFAMSGDFLHQFRSGLLQSGHEAKNIRTMTIAATRVALGSHKAPDYHWLTADDADFFFPWGRAK